MRVDDLLLSIAAVITSLAGAVAAFGALFRRRDPPTEDPDVIQAKLIEAWLAGRIVVVPSEDET